MIFVDANIPMYLVGAEHPNKRTSQVVLEQLVAAQERLVTSAEVFQELLHRYTAIRCREAIQPAFETLEQLVDEIFPIAPETVVEAKHLVLAQPSLSARDAVHVATMRHHRVTQILSFDRGFDRVRGITRLPTP